MLRATPHPRRPTGHADRPGNRRHRRGRGGGSVVTIWYALHGHAPDEVAGHRARARWYTTKTEPSYDDMAVKLRRVILAARYHSPCPEQATPQETRAVLAAWAAAGT